MGQLVASTTQVAGIDQGIDDEFTGGVVLLEFEGDHSVFHNIV